MYEVELKVPLVEVAAVEGALGRLAARARPSIEQVDIYFSHPSRDFAATDEALRLRREGRAVAITWKGPRLGVGAKTRREIELPLAGTDHPEGGSGTLAAWCELLESLGFCRVREVLKRRRPAAITWRGSAIEAAIDTVAGLGDYLELEILAAENGIPQALSQLESLAAEIGLGEPERRSYLEMLLATDRSH